MLSLSANRFLVKRFLILLPHRRVIWFNLQKHTHICLRKGWYNICSICIYSIFFRMQWLTSILKIYHSVSSNEDSSYAWYIPLQYNPGYLAPFDGKTSLLNLVNTYIKITVINKLELWVFMTWHILLNYVNKYASYLKRKSPFYIINDILLEQFLLLFVDDRY